ncbi:MAG: AtpZ/AtpI family protein [Candidatus Acidiferrum sp.]
MDNNQNKTDSSPPSPRKAKDFSTQFGLAMELPFMLFGAIAIGGLLGYLLDHWLHTKVLFTLILGGLGFYAGLRDVLRRLPADGDGKS